MEYARTNTDVHTSTTQLHLFLPSQVTFKAGRKTYNNLVGRLAPARREIVNIATDAEIQGEPIALPFSDGLFVADNGMFMGADGSEREVFLSAPRVMDFVSLSTSCL